MSVEHVIAGASMEQVVALMANNKVFTCSGEY